MKFILSENEEILVNIDNVASFNVRKTERSVHPYEIVAMYPAVSTDVLCDTLACFNSEKECKEAFNSLIVSLTLNPTIVYMKDCIEPFKL